MFTRKAGPNSSFISFGMIGNVAVPSHWYKLVLYHLKDPVKPYDIEAWIFPNENVYESKNHQHFASLVDTLVNYLSYKIGRSYILFVTFVLFFEITEGEKLHDFHKTLEDIYELSNERFPVQKDDARSFNWDKDS